MEKGIEIVARYHCPKEYFVEVTTEKSVLAGRDYWFVKKTVHEKYLCSAENSKMKIKKYIRLSIS